MTNSESLWKIASGSQLPIIPERLQSTIELPVAPGTTPEVTLISGSLPPGTRLEGITIVGTSFEVAYDTIFTAVFRAERDDIIDDCTLSFIVVGSDNPIWITNKGLLSVGTNNAYYILDNAIIDFQLIANDTDTLAGAPLSYFIADGDGTLPPGVTLTQNGKLYGIVEPLLALDKLYIDAGYDEQPYASLPMDYAVQESIYYNIDGTEYLIPAHNRKKLNRYYPFAVTVTDGITFDRREFTIYVVGDDFFTVDNTVMQVANGVFTADNTNIRTPVWITPNDLGYKRASNYVTLYMETINSPNLTGVIAYTQDNTNPGTYQLKSTNEIINNGYYEIRKVFPYFPKSGKQTVNANEWTVITPETLSILPPGLSLDSQNGTITGTIPVQPAITKTYQFTLRATRFSDVSGYVEIYGIVFEDTMSGNSSFKIKKLNLTSDVDSLNDIVALRNQDITLNDRVYRILNVNNSHPDYDVVNLLVDGTYTALEPTVALNVSRSTIANTDYLFVSRLSEIDKNKFLNRALIFSNTESYLITDIVPYIAYNMVAITGSPSYSNTDKQQIISAAELEFGESVYINFSSTPWQIQMVSNVASRSLEKVSSFLLPYNLGIQLSYDVTATAKINNIDKIIQDMETAFEVDIAYTIIDPEKHWQLSMASTTESNSIDNIKSFFASTVEITKRIGIRNNEDKIVVDKNWINKIYYPRTIGIAAFKDEYFTKLLEISQRNEFNTPSKAKTFTINIIGEIDSTVTWITPSYLGTINANFISTLKVEATTTVPESAMVYTIVKGKLPYGLTLNYRGGIFGVANQFATDELLGLTTFDNNTTKWDTAQRSNTKFDRQFRFTVKAEDRFKLIATEREFILDVVDADIHLYTDIYVKPLLKIPQRQIYSKFISDISIFDYTKIYRPSDVNFGLQREMKMLIFAGIEAKSLDYYVSAAAKNHKRKRFYLGDFKKAVAKELGTNEIVYEVIYIDVIDPANPVVGKAVKMLDIQTTSKLTVDSYQIISSANTVKADSSVFKVNDVNDHTRYVSNITNMRDRIKTVGVYDRNYLPLWMRTPQDNHQIFNYTTAIPVCYCLPGTADTILLNINNHIKNTNFSIQQIDFDIDRYIIQRTDSTNQEQYVVFANYQFNV